MEPKEFYEILLRIEEKIGKLEGKTDGLCVNIKGISNRLNLLPCEDHMKRMNTKLATKVDSKNYALMLGIIVSAIMLAFSYTYLVEAHIHRHETDTTPHYFTNTPDNYRGNYLLTPNELRSEND